MPRRSPPPPRSSPETATEQAPKTSTASDYRPSFSSVEMAAFFAARRHMEDAIYRFYQSAPTDILAAQLLVEAATDHKALIEKLAS